MGRFGCGSDCPRQDRSDSNWFVPRSGHRKDQRLAVGRDRKGDGAFRFATADLFRLRDVWHRCNQTDVETEQEMNLLAPGYS